MSDQEGVPAFGIWDSVEDDFLFVEGRYRLYWKRSDAERMLVAIGDPRYSVVETRIIKREED